jgi:predicted dehydrogenase
VQAQGLGGSYGAEKLMVGHRRAQGGAPDTQEIDLRAGTKEESQDDVWAIEWQAFVNEVLEQDNPENHNPAIKPASAIDAWEALRIVEAAYAASRTASAVPLVRPATQHSDKAFTAAQRAD